MSYCELFDIVDDAKDLPGARIHVAEKILPPQERGLNRFYELIDKIVRMLNDGNCMSIATAFMRNGNEDHDPCDNFYEFACGNWHTVNPIPKDAGLVNNIYILKEKSYQQLSGLLQERSKITEDGLVTKAKQIYKVCTDRAGLEKQEYGPLLRAIKKRGRWPMMKAPSARSSELSWEKVHNNYARTTGEGALFNVHVHSPECNGISRIHITEPRTVFGRFLLIDHTKMNIYKSYLQNVLTILMKFKKPREKLPTFEKDLTDVLKFRYALQNIVNMTVWEAVFLNEEYYPTTLFLLQNWNNKLAVTHNATQVEWRNYLQDTFEGTRKIWIFNQDIVYVNEIYLKKLLILLKETAPHVIVNHIHLHFVENHLQYTTTRMRELMDGVQYSITGDHVEAFNERDCIYTNQMSFVISNMYSERFFSSSMRTEVMKIYEAIVSTVQDIIEDSWLDEQTKKIAVNKLNHMKGIIGHRYYDYNIWQHYYQNIAIGNFHLQNVLECKRIEYRAQLEKLHPEKKYYAYRTAGFYIRTQNVFFFSAAFLQWPMYTQSAKRAVAYGTTGFLIAHEVFHAFDAEGRLYDSTGCKVVDWWSKESAIIYDEKMYCVLQTYLRYTKEQLLSMGVREEIRSLQTIDEDFADMMGLVAAYKAFSKVKSTVSEDQIFFRAYANLLCEHIRPEYVGTLLKECNHSMHAVRVNAAVAEIPEFATAFNCSANSFMNPQEKCNFWQNTEENRL